MIQSAGCSTVMPIAHKPVRCGSGIT